MGVVRPLILILVREGTENGRFVVCSDPRGFYLRDRDRKLFKCMYIPYSEGREHSYRKLALHELQPQIKMVRPFSAV